MKIDVKYVAHLARLELSDEQTAKFQKQLKDILGYIEKLNSLNTEKVMPLSHATSQENVFRQDRAKPSLTTEQALLNAPAKEGKFFKVPKVIK